MQEISSNEVEAVGPEVWYRMVTCDQRPTPEGLWMPEQQDTVGFQLREYVVDEWLNKGVRLLTPGDAPGFKIVMDNDRHPFAAPTRDEARYDFTKTEVQKIQEMQAKINRRLKAVRQLRKARFDDA